MHLAQLHSGKNLALQAYRHQLDESIPALCPRCQKEEQTLEHLFLQCPGSKTTNFRRGGGLQLISADAKSITVYSPGQEDTPGGWREVLLPVTTTTGAAIQANDGEALIRLSSAMQQCEMTLEQMSYSTDMNSFETLLQISRRLPSNLKSKWVERMDHLLDQGREPTFHDLAEFMENRARIATTLYSQSLFESETPDVKQA